MLERILTAVLVEHVFVQRARIDAAENTELALVGLLRSVRAFHVRLKVVLELVCFGADVAAPRSLIGVLELHVSGD